MILTRNTIQQEAQCQVSSHSASSLPPRRGTEHSQGFSQSCHDISMRISICNLFVHSRHFIHQLLEFCVFSTELVIFIVPRGVISCHTLRPSEDNTVIATPVTRVASH